MLHTKHKRGAILSALLLSAGATLLAAPGQAANYDIYVAARDTPALANATAKANDTTVFAERSMERGLVRAATILSQKGNDVVTVRVAGGQYGGKAGAGNFELPTIANSNGSLRIVGGYNDDFSSRDPFHKPTVLVTTPGRNGPFIAMGQRSELAELVISGFLFDAAPSNAYDKKNNSLLRAQSRTYALLAFSVLKTRHLAVTDNIFINGPHSVLEPNIAPASADTVVDIVNNYFIGNVNALKIGAGIGSRNGSVSVVNFKSNSVIANWPYNPDPTSANVGAVNLYHKDGAAKLDIQDNLFAYNAGGAFQHDWPEGRMPKITLRHNLFFKNAALFLKEKQTAGDGVIYGKFGTNPTYSNVTLATLEDDFDYDVKDNVTTDPGLSYFDLNMTSEAAANGDDLDIYGWAQKLEYDPSKPPLPGGGAASFGVQVGKVWMP